MKILPSWVFVVLAIPWPVFAYMAWASGRPLSGIIGFLVPLFTCVSLYFSLRNVERFESKPEFQEYRSKILSGLRVGYVPEISASTSPEGLYWSRAREHFGITKHGPGRFLRTTFWSNLAFGHFDQVEGRITAISLSPNFGWWRRYAEAARIRVEENQDLNQPSQPTPLKRRG